MNVDSALVRSEHLVSRTNPKPKHKFTLVMKNKKIKTFTKLRYFSEKSCFFYVFDLQKSAKLNFSEVNDQGVANVMAMKSFVEFFYANN